MRVCVRYVAAYFINILHGSVIIGLVIMKQIKNEMFSWQHYSVGTYGNDIEYKFLNDEILKLEKKNIVRIMYNYMLMAHLIDLTHPFFLSACIRQENERSCIYVYLLYDFFFFFVYYKIFETFRECGFFFFILC